MIRNNKIKIAVIGGSGLDDPRILADPKESNPKTPFGKTSSPLIAGKIGGVDVVVLARHGKKHSIPPTRVPFRANLWALKKAGCTHILATTACGSLRENLKPGDLFFPDQFIDLTKRRELTIFGDKVVHTSLAEPFCPQLREVLIKTARGLKFRHRPQGAIITIEGPRFSTRAESLFFRTIGGDAINMSTVPEVVLARELGICYASIAMTTDYDAWRQEEKPVTWDMILETMKKNAEKVKRLLLKTIPQIESADCGHCREK